MMSSPQSSDSSKSTHTEIALVNPSGPQSKNKKSNVERHWFACDWGSG